MEGLRTKNVGEFLIFPCLAEMETDATAEAAAVAYEDIITRFGAAPITDDLLKRFETVTGTKAHPMLRRGLFYAHRDFEEFLSYYEKGHPIYIYTGRGPSSGLCTLDTFYPSFSPSTSRMHSSVT